jgi:O-antigen biosynthesis protein WbqP
MNKLISFVIIIILLPVFIGISLLIIFISGRPVLHISDRVGLNNNIFKMYKFRTMKIHTPQLATDLLANPFNYYTLIGKILRKTSLDELPQLFNILFGHMNFIGPRPALYNQYKLILARNDLKINKIKPGLTGLAQVCGRDTISDSKKIKYDLFYCKKKSMRLNMYILILTFINFNKDIKH